ncbi:MlaA family lipoprotein [Biformimicrobium ophioploci]|uniref:VacJ family lipoprotein n=1 Tax=Biformimicrobium ophioploci TaxID=3036711 RepID=A0ABQ6LZ33_9GAMM|nr:VacJ family lipoprotein [Microbulbifer sp. NKW57]GMG87297.1 hypothetical protein MNKW57_16180 [Microbulbifer sp. NKW57]
MPSRIGLSGAALLLLLSVHSVAADDAPAPADPEAPVSAANDDPFAEPAAAAQEPAAAPAPAVGTEGDPFADPDPALLAPEPAEQPAATPESSIESSGGDPFADPAELEEKSTGEEDPFALEDDPFADPAASSDGDWDDDEYGFGDEEFDGESFAERDPWERFNRVMFGFNDTFDRWILKPVAKGYQKATPEFVRTGIGNFFSNLFEIRNGVNSALQWKWGEAGRDASRFGINTTFGIVGLFDVATKLGIEAGDGEDFGQTMAVWGLPAGPYLVVPLYGPTTIRDGAGDFVDYYLYPPNYLDNTRTRNQLYLLRTIDTRADLLSAEELLSGDRYTLLRDAFLQRRDYLIADGEIEDDFGGDFGDFGNDDFGEDESDDTTEASSDTSSGSSGAEAEAADSDPFAEPSESEPGENTAPAEGDDFGAGSDEYDF